MAAVDDLTPFVRDSLTRGLSRADITTALTGAGWPPEQIAAALALYADVPFPVPVPRPRAYVSARDAFLYLVMFTTLYLSAYNLGLLLFELIDRAFPDPASDGFSATLLSALRWSISSLIVAVPVFLYTSLAVRRRVEDDPVQRAAGLRIQLTYLTLFVASCVLIGDVTALIYTLLGGELTMRFVLKALTIGAIGGSAFWYYMSDVREAQDDRP